MLQSLCHGSLYDQIINLFKDFYFNTWWYKIGYSGKKSTINIDNITLKKI